MRFGVIGTGEVVERWHIPAIRASGNQVYSILGRSGDSAHTFAQRQGALRSYGTDQITQFMSDPLLDAVIIASPDHAHVKQALVAAEYKKPMLIEKPLGRITDDYGLLRKKVTENKVPVGVGFHHRFHEGHRLVRNGINATYPFSPDSPSIKSISLAWGYDFSSRPGWRNNDTSDFWSLNALGVHLIDLSHWLIGAGTVTPQEISLSSHNHSFKGNDECSHLAYSLGGVDVQIVTSTTQRITPHVEVNALNNYSMHFLKTLGPRGAGTIASGWHYNQHIALEDQNLDVATFDVVDPYQKQIEALIAEMNGEHTELATLDDAIWNLELLKQAKEVQRWM